MNKTPFPTAASVLILLAAGLPVPAQEVQNTSYVSRIGERVLRIETTVPASLKATWKAFTTVRGLSSWAATVVALDLRNGGTIRTRYDSKGAIGDPGTITMGIINTLQEDLITLKVTLNETFPESIRREDANLQEIIQLKSLSEGRTKVVSSMVGWGKSRAWDDAYNFFAKGNDWSYRKLAESLSKPMRTGAVPEPDPMVDPINSEYRFKNGDPQRIVGLAGGALAPGPGRPSSESRLTELVVAVRSADYRGDRAALERLDRELGELDVPQLAAYGSYWQGFARWRRAVNGFNETPTPSDLTDDLEKAISRFRVSLERHSDWIEPRIGMVGCWATLIFLAGENTERRSAILKEYVPALRAMETEGRENPRALWIIGGVQLSAPPPYGGDPVKAAATMRRGLAAAWRESATREPAWIPRWGGPENLMNLAYLYSQGAAQNRALSAAYAEGAVTAVPEWHYVRDILLPRIEAISEAAPH